MRIAILLSFLMVIAACAPQHSSTESLNRWRNQNIAIKLTRVSGSIVVPNSTDPVSLPSDAIITVHLHDISRQDVAAHIVGQRIYYGANQLPLAYSVEFEAHKIQESRTYTVTARVEDTQGNLLYTTEGTHNISSHGTERNIDIKLTKVE